MTITAKNIGRINVWPTYAIAREADTAESKFTGQLTVWRTNEEARANISHEEEGGGGGAPDWVPEGAVAFLDFKNGQYWWGGAEYTQGESVENNDDWDTFNPALIVGGVGVRSNTGADCTFVLTAGAATGLLPSDGGFTCVLRYSNTASGTTASASTTIEVLDLPDYNVEWIATFQQSTGSGQLNTLSSDSGVSVTGDAGTSHVAAITMAPGNIAGSVDGNTVAVVASVADNTTATHIAVGVNTSVANGTATAILESLAFYTPVANGALPAMSAP